MKNSIYILAILASAFVCSCNQPKYDANQTAATTSKANITNDCYHAVFEKDTADLKIWIASDGKVTGALGIRYGQKPNSVERVINKGKVEGRFHGDTLFVNYLYRSGSINKTLYQNPLALLKQGDKLIMGVGQIETSLGRSYFVKNKPIDFEKGKFKFSKVNCSIFKSNI
jgi:hypothetical protein